MIAEQKQQIAKLEQINGELQSKLEEALRRNAELEAKLAQNSTNSSKPPSSDLPSTDKKKKKRDKKGKRKRGGQWGHKRHERKLVPESEVSEVTAVKPTHCRKCKKRLWGSDSDTSIPIQSDIQPEQASRVFRGRHTNGLQGLVAGRRQHGQCMGHVGRFATPPAQRHRRQVRAVGLDQ